MTSLQIQNNSSNDFTLVSNRFLDIYMPETNGEFVKIYLCLLRSSVGHVPTPSLYSIADTLNCTEKDIERALKYWCKKNLLALEFDDKKHISKITFFDLDTTASQNTTKAADTFNNVVTAKVPVNKSTTPTKSSLTPSRVKDLKKNEDIVQLLFIAEQYLGKTLSPTEVSNLLYFYEDLHFSTDLIEYLIEYCVSKGSKSTRYIEKVALAWHLAGITTVKAAKAESNTYNRNFFSILKALGISNRNPVDSEITTMNRWLNEFGFSLDIIQEACNRTVSTTGKPSFPYADGILTSWHEEKVHTLTDIASLDKAHKETKTTATKPSNRAKSPNKFNNFTQRNYNFDDLEKQLLKKQLQEPTIKE